MSTFNVMRPTLNSRYEAIIDSKIFERLLPIFLKDNKLGIIEKFTAWGVLTFFFFLFILQIKKLEKIQKNALILLSVFMLQMHVLSNMDVTGYTLFFSSVLMATLSSILIIKGDISNCAIFVCNIYIVALCVLSHTASLGFTYNILMIVSAILLYMTVVYMIWKNIHDIALRCVFNILILKMLINLNFFMQLFPLLVSKVDQQKTVAAAAKYFACFGYVAIIGIFTLFGFLRIRNNK